MKVTKIKVQLVFVLPDDSGYKVILLTLSVLMGCYGEN